MNLLHRLLPGIALVAGTLLLSVGLQALAAWSAPGGSPPASNAYAPLNSGPTAQTKSGGLNVIGNVGIGTVSPATKLVVSNNGAQGVELDPIGAGPESAAYLQAYNRSTISYAPMAYIGASHNFWTPGGGYGTMYINSSGNVGIGTVSPATKLDVQGVMAGNFGTAGSCCASGPTLSLSEGTNINNRLPWLQFHTAGFQEAYLRLAKDTRLFEMGDNQGAGVDLALLNGAGTRSLYLSPRGTSYFNGGNVGIGTTNPLQKLDVAGNVNVTGCFMVNGTCISSGSGLSGGSANYIPKWTSGTTLSGTSNIYDNGTNVGIGTVGPREKLEVSGNSYVSGLGKFGDLNAINNGISLWGTPQGVLVGASNGMMVGIGLSGAGSVGIGWSNGSTPYGAVGWDSASGNFGVYTYGRNLALHTDSGRSVFVDSNFGIGTAYPSQKLEVAGNIKAGRFYMGDNQYGTNVPGIGTDGWNVGVTTNGAFAVTNGGSGYQPVYASDYYIANIGKWASQLGGGGTTQTVTVVGGLMYGYNQTVSCPAGYVMTGCTAGSSGDHGGRIRAATNASCTGEADNGQGVYIFGWCLKQ